MKTIQLTDTQREAILDEMRSWRDEDKISFTIEFDELTVTCEGWLHVDGYTIYDNDNLCPPEYIETLREACVSFSADIDGEPVYIGSEIEDECVSVLVDE